MVSLYRGVVLTLASNMGTATLTKGTPDTITRSSGSFLTDGWLQNMRVFLLGSTTLANDVATFLSAAVTSTTLTMTASTLNTSESFPSTGKLIQLSYLASMSLPASSGSSSSVASVSGLNPADLATLFGVPDNFLTLGASDMLLASVSTAVAANKSVDIVVDGADY